MGQSGLPHARHVFNQQVAAREERDEGQLDGFILAANDAAHGLLQLGEGIRVW